MAAILVSLIVAVPLQECDAAPGPNPSPTTETTAPPSTPTTETTAPTTETTAPPTVPPTPQIPAQCLAGFSSTASVQIVGGYESPDGCRTYQVALLDNLRQFCGGTLIDDDWVLTAGHCLDDISLPNLSVAVGGQTLTAFTGEVIPAADLFVHPLYNRAGYSFDVGLIRLASAANPSYTRAKLSNPTVDAAIGSPGQYLLSSGWGVTQSYGQATSAELLEVRLPVSPSWACSSIGISDREICSNALGVSTCFGDSGGPWAGVYNGEIHVLGVVSYGDAGCEVYSVFARVSSYQGWLNDTMALYP